MTSIELYYTLEELAKKWNITTEKILFAAKKNNIKLSVWWNGFFVINGGAHLSDWLWVDDFIEIPPGVVGCMFDRALNCGGLEDEFTVRDGVLKDGRKGWLHYIAPDSPELDDLPINNAETKPDGKLLRKLSIRPAPIKISDLCVLPEEISRVEKEQQEQVNKDSIPEAHHDHGDKTDTNHDKVYWTFPDMRRFTGLDRKTIINRANWLGIEFEERPPKRGAKKEKGLHESDLRRIINYKP